MSLALAIGYGIASYALGCFVGYGDARSRWESRRDRVRDLLRHASRR